MRAYATDKPILIVANYETVSGLATILSPGLHIAFLCK
jgi:hypothetical protein